MKQSYLEVTYRKGKVVAAYYYLPRGQEDRAARTEKASGGLLVDYAADGRPIGIEIASPFQIDIAELNALLTRLKQSPVGQQELRPLLAA